jgi:anti-anti-sigma regulatory factor
MQVETEEAAVVALIGGKAATDEERLDQAVASGATRIVVDLGEAPELETHDLNVLLGARSRLMERGGRVALVVPRRLRRLIELMSFDRRFVVAQDRLEALRLLGVVRTPGPHASVRRAA